MTHVLASLPTCRECQQALVESREHIWYCDNSACGMYLMEVIASAPPAKRVA